MIAVLPDQNVKVPSENRVLARKTSRSASSDLRLCYSHREEEAVSASPSQSESSKSGERDLVGPERVVAHAPLNVEPVNAHDIAAAVPSSGIRRILVISSEAHEERLVSVDLTRRLVATGSKGVLIDLTKSGEPSKGMGVVSPDAGFSSLLRGAALLAEVIHRDHFTRTHVVPGTCFNLAEATNSDLETIAILTEAFAEVYDCSVIALERDATAALAHLLDKDTAVVVASQESDPDLPNLFRTLSELGLEDVLLL